MDLTAGSQARNGLTKLCNTLMILLELSAPKVLVLLQNTHTSGRSGGQGRLPTIPAAAAHPVTEASTVEPRLPPYHTRTQCVQVQYSEVPLSIRSRRPRRTESLWSTKTHTYICIHVPVYCYKPFKRPTSASFFIQGARCGAAPKALGIQSGKLQEYRVQVLGWALSQTIDGFGL